MSMNGNTIEIDDSATPYSSRNAAAPVGDTAMKRSVRRMNRLASPRLALEHPEYQGLFVQVGEDRRLVGDPETVHDRSGAAEPVDVDEVEVTEARAEAAASRSRSGHRSGGCRRGAPKTTRSRREGRGRARGSRRPVRSPRPTGRRGPGRPRRARSRRRATSGGRSGAPGRHPCRSPARATKRTRMAPEPTGAQPTALYGSRYRPHEIDTFLERGWMVIDLPDTRRVARRPRRAGGAGCRQARRPGCARSRTTTESSTTASTRTCTGI